MTDDRTHVLQFDGAVVDRDKLFEAEDLLEEAGITFDTGGDVSGTHTIREWHLDWSLSGANLVCRE